MVCVIVVQVSSAMYRSHACAPCHPGTPWRLISTLKDRQHPARVACGVTFSLTRDVVVSSLRESQRPSAFLLRKMIILQYLQYRYSTFFSSESLGPVRRFYVYCISAVTTFLLQGQLRTTVPRGSATFLCETLLNVRPFSDCRFRLLSLKGCTL